MYYIIIRYHGFGIFIFYFFYRVLFPKFLSKEAHETPHLHKLKHNLQLLEWSKQVHVGAFILVANELGVELLVAGE